VLESEQRVEVALARGSDREVVRGVVRHDARLVERAARAQIGAR
jgi:hypothetical protein